MKMEEYIKNIEVYLLNDRELFRLLHYKANPLDTALPDIQDLPNDQKWKIIDTVFIKTNKSPDSSIEPICRICMYAGNRQNTRNYAMADQDIVFDIYAHIEKYDELDLRLAKLCDRLNEILYGERLAGIGKCEFSRGLIIPNPPNGYVGYRLVYSFGSWKQ